MNDVFITADCHIAHRNIVLHAKRKDFTFPNPNYDPTQPKNIKTNWPLEVNLEKHNQFIIDNWNHTVSKKDITIIVGDFIWSNELHYLHMLNGKKILVIGNHDDDGPKYLKNFSASYHFLCKTFEKKFYCVFFHYPMLSWPSSCYGSWHFHGHCHGRMPEYKDILRCDVGVDVWDYKPVAWETLKQKMLGKVPFWKERMSKQNFDEVKDDQVEIVKNINCEILKNKREK